MPIFKVMTWNVESLFRPEYGASPEEQQRYEQKLSLLSDIIEQYEPDVVALQEIGGEAPFQDLSQALHGDYPHAQLSLFPDRRGIRVGFLTKHPIQEHEDIVAFPPGPALDIHTINAVGESVPLTHMGRGALRIRIRKDNLTADLITTHLKSKLLTYPRSGGSVFSPRDEEERTQVAGIALLRRAAEAVTLRIKANQLLEGDNPVPLIILGDFNDVPEAATSQILNGPSGSEIGTRGFDPADQGDDVRLFNLAPLIEQERRYSRIYRGRGELLDQIIASEQFFPRQPDGKRRRPTEVDSHIDFADQLFSIGDNPNTRIREIKPDHAPVTATFAL